MRDEKERVMVRKGSRVTETELAILEVLWTSQPCTVRDIVGALYDEHKPSLHATVKSLLERLEEKGYVQCDAGGFAHKFSATISREAYVGEALEELAENHFGGAFAPMLLSLVEKTKLSRKQRDAIKRIVEGLRDAEAGE